MCGKATLATLVSSTSMKVASITVRAITHGFVTPSWRARANKLLMPLFRSPCLRHPEARALGPKNPCILL